MEEMRMTRRLTLNRVVVLALLSLSLTGCAKKEETPPPATTEAPKSVPFRVLATTLGNRLDADKKVVAPASTFGTRDTIYVSIASEGTVPEVTLRAVWKFADGQLVADDAQKLAPTGPAQTEFHVSNSKPWPKGKYTVEVFSDTTSAGRKDFTVQ
jgi:hypothetical protein